MVKKTHDKAEFIFAVQELLQKKMVGTQEEIKKALEKKWFKVSQVKVSRVLHKIGAIKITEGHQVVYRLPTELVSITPSDSLKQLVLNIAHNGSMIVIQTAPGCAQFVARFIDLSKDLPVLGTVAGDDTIFIAPLKIKEIEKLHKQIYKVILG
jgi:transcriptional regulator of arginine metabolism